MSIRNFIHKLNVYKIKNTGSPNKDISFVKTHKSAKQICFCDGEESLSTKLL